MILEGTTSSGAVVPVQVTADGKVVAEGRTGPEGPQGPEGPPGPASDIWDRNGTVVSPTNAGDNIVTTGSIGAGTVTPSVQLDVVGEARFERIGFPARWGKISIEKGTFELDTEASQSHVFAVGGTETARFSSAGVFTLGSSFSVPAVSLDPGTTGSPLVRDSNGRLGVGTATPSVTLEAAGPVKASRAIFHNATNVVTNPLIEAFSDVGGVDTRKLTLNAGGVFTLGDGTTNAVTLDPGSTGRPLVRDSAGRLLVGMNSAPAGTLAGDVVCHGAVVLQSPNGTWWAIEVQDDGTLFASQTSIR